VQLTIQEGDQSQAQIATILQEVWKQLGINVTVQPLAPANYAGAVFGGKVQAAIRYDGPGVDDPGYYLGYDMRTNLIGYGPNIGHISMPAADHLLDQARATSSPKVAQALYDKITRAWRGHWPKIVFYADHAAVVMSRKMKTFVYEPGLVMDAWGK